MMTHIHMQDQIKNRIDNIMFDERMHKFEEYLQTITTFIIVFVFLAFGLSW